MIVILIRLSTTLMKQWGIIKRSRKFHGLHNTIICFFSSLPNQLRFSAEVFLPFLYT